MANQGAWYLKLEELWALVSALGDVDDLQLVVSDIQLRQSGEDPLRAGGVRNAVHDERHGREVGK